MLFLIAWACTAIDGTDEPTHDPEVVLGEPRQVVLADNLPPGVEAQTSNNNLDVVEHTDGRLYLAFRTGPNHFASDAVHLYVLSSDDNGEQWQLEQDVTMQTDLREFAAVLVGGDHDLVNDPCLVLLEGRRLVLLEIQDARIQARPLLLLDHMPLHAASYGAFNHDLCR